MKGITVGWWVSDLPHRWKHAHYWDGNWWACSPRPPFEAKTFVDSNPYKLYKCTDNRCPKCLAACRLEIAIGSLLDE